MLWDIVFRCVGGGGGVHAFGSRHLDPHVSELLFSLLCML